MTISAIPMNDDRVASHFTKALSLLFVDDQGQEICRIANPAVSEGCAGKQRLVELLLAHKAERVVVRNIGERMLGKLLAHQLQVVQTECGRRSVAELANPKAAQMQPLTHASEGHLSFNHELKQANGHGGCHHGGQGKQAAAAGCCGSQTSTGAGQGCRGGGHGHGQGGHGHGQGGRGHGGCGRH